MTENEKSILNDLMAKKHKEELWRFVETLLKEERERVIKLSELKHFKRILVDLILSHYRLGVAEYNKVGSTYTKEHFHYKAEEAIMHYLMDNEPEIWDELLKKVTELGELKRLKQLKEG